MNKLDNNRSQSIDNLKILLTILVVLHHAFLGYTTHGTFTLIVDPNRSYLFDIITGFLDTFFMFLFFFISGLFTFTGLNKLGTSRYLKKRVIRLGVPFLIGWLIINTPGYILSFGTYMKYVQGTGITIGSFFNYWINTLGLSTTGHLWFLWVLILFNLIASLIFKIFNKSLDNNRTFIHHFISNSFIFFPIFILTSILLYGFTTKLVGNSFLSWGPFTSQLNRVPLYFYYFIVGAILNYIGIENSTLKKKSRLMNHWWLLILLSVIFFVILKSSWITSSKLSNEIALITCFVFVTTFSSFGLIILFLKHFNSSTKFLSKLSNDTYGIYIFHYTVVAFVQFSLLFLNVGGVVKGIISGILSVIVSWGIVLVFKKLSVMRKFI